MEKIIPWIMYILSFISLLIYIRKKNKKRKYILSIINPYIIQYIFILFVIPWFAFSAIAWIKLLGDSAYDLVDIYHDYLLQSLEINCFGFFIFINAMNFFEFNEKKSNWLYKSINIIEKYIVSDILKIEFIICSCVYIVIMFGWSGIGLLGENNISANDGILYYVIFILQNIITMLTLYWGFYVVNNKKGKKFFIIGCIECILMGKRATIMMDVLFAVIVYFLYKTYGSQNRQKVLKRSFKYMILIVIFAVIMGMLRSTDNSFTFIENILYGNNFSDIRDGAMVLFAFENNYQDGYLYGKSYLSALISFIPSSISSFRYDWDWGRFSTLVLLGWEGHPGLRGGWAMESYLNFGVLGIVLSAITAAYLYSSLEKYFYNEMFIYNSKINEKSILLLYVLILLARRIFCSAGFFGIYVYLSFILVNILIVFICRKVYINYNKKGEV